MSKLGFKEINPSNWLERDEVLKGFVKITPSGSQSLTAHDYLNHILKPILSESVPEDVRRLFEVARGAMVYGYFFYPLYTLAAEQLFRVTETAITHKCKLSGTPKSEKFFKQKLKYLLDNGVISNSEYAQWDSVRNLRNITSHPKHQLIFTPGDAIGILENICKQVNFLFNTA